MKLFFQSILFAALCASVAGFTEEETQAGLDRVLQGAHVGAAFSEFVALHPEAVYSDEDIRDVPVVADKPGALLITHKRDPFLGVNGFANIGFKDGLLYELVSVWTGSEEDLQSKRGRFFTAAIQRHGHAYLHETILVHPHTPEERPAALFLWQEKDAMILAFYTAPSSLDPHPKAALTYAMFAPGDPFLADILEKHPASDAQHEQAWDDMDDIMPLLEALE